jgi:hypothetical protein
VDLDLDVPLGLPSPDIDLDPGPVIDIEVGLELLAGDAEPEKNPPFEYDGEGDLVRIDPKELKNEPKPSLEDETAGV